MQRAVTVLVAAVTMALVGLFVVSPSLETAVAGKGVIFDVKPNTPSPRVIANKCTEDPKFAQKNYTPVIYDTTIRQLRQAVEESSGVERQLNEEALKNVIKCEERDVPGKRRASGSCDRLASEYEYAVDAHTAAAAKAGRKPNVAKEVVPEFKNQMIKCLPKMPCAINDDVQMANAATLFKLLAAMWASGTITKDDLVAGKDRFLGETKTIGRKFCGVTVRRLLEQCQQGKDINCGTPDGLKQALDNFASGRWTFGKSTPATPATRGHFRR